MTGRALVTVAHGTRVSAGNRVAADVTARAARRLGVPGHTSYVELCAPSVRAVVRRLETPAVMVPLLLSTGYHVQYDLPSALGGAPFPVRSAGPLGPHPLLAEVMCHRLRGAGARRGDPVVLVAAGSRDPDAGVDLAVAGRLLEARWGARVRVATVGGAGRSVEEAVGEARADGRVAVAPYLLASGHFSRRCQALARNAGAAVAADVLGAHPLVVELVVRRYRAVAAISSAAA
jgi:sirohydrochlorin ferrochelatase